MNITLKNSNSVHISQRLEPTDDPKVFELSGDGLEGVVYIKLHKRVDHLVAMSATEYWITDEEEEEERDVDLLEAFRFCVGRTFSKNFAHFLTDDGRKIYTMYQPLDDDMTHYLPVYYSTGGIPRPVFLTSSTR